MKHRILVLSLILMFTAGAVAQRGMNPFGDKTKHLNVVDSLRTTIFTANGAATFNDAVIINSTVSVTGGVDYSGKLIVADSLRVGATSILQGNITANGKLVLADSLRVGKTSILQGNITANGKLVLADSARIGSNVIVQGTSTLNGNVGVTGKITSTDSLRINQTSNLIGNLTLGGTITGTTAIRDTNVFTTTATVDTVLITGLRPTHFVFGNARAQAIGTGEELGFLPGTDTLFVSRTTGTTSALKYQYMIIR